MSSVGIIGSGFMAAVHAAAWPQAGIAVRGVHSDDERSGRELAEGHGASFHGDVDRLLRDVDVVAICTPTDTHLEFISRAATQGRDIVCEKPLARNYKDALAAIDVCDAAGVRLLVGHVVRFFPDYAAARHEVSAGRIGKPALIRLKRCGSPPWSDWFSDQQRSGGVALDLMIHDFDYARWIAGEVRSVFAQGARVHTPATGPHDHVQAVLTHQSGAISHVEGSWAYPAGSFLTELEISGDGGFVSSDSERTRPLHVLGADDSEDAVKVPPATLVEEPWTTEIRHFASVLRGEVKPLVTAHDAAQAVAVADAVEMSLDTGRPVSLAEVPR